MANNVKISSFSLALLIAGSIFTACSTTKSTQSPKSADTQKSSQVTVGVVDGEPVSYQEVVANYQPSMDEKPVSADDLVDFLPSYLDYKAKVKEARKAGYFERDDIRKEYNQFANQAAYSYWMNNKLEQEMLDTLMRRSEEELKVKHVLIRLPNNPDPADTAKAYNKLMEARKKYENGKAGFDELINQYSSKMRGRNMGGEVGYFTAGQTVKSFEDAAYALPEDSVSYPVRSQFGYHLILMLDRRARHSDRKISHIFFQKQNRNEKADSTLWAKANDTWNKLNEGADWDSLARKVSDDRNSANNGGQLGWFNYGRYPETIIDTIMALKKPGDYSRPFESRYGIQIIELDSIRSYPTEEAHRQALLKQLKNLPRYKNNKQLVNNRLRNIGNAEWHHDNLSSLMQYLHSKDSTLIKNIRFPENVSSLPLYSFNGKTYQNSDFITWLKENRGQANGGDYQRRWADDFESGILEQQLVPLTRKQFPEFGQKVQSYLNGLVVFQISEDSVWSKSTVDTTKLRSLYEQNPAEYRYPKRFVYSQIVAQDDSTIQKAYQLLSDGVAPDSLRKQLNRVQVRYDTTGYIESMPYSKLVDIQAGSYTQPFAYNKRQNIMYLHQVLKPRQMTFKEAFDRVFSAYQPQREKAWVQQLRNLYDVQSYPGRLRKAFQQNPPKSFGSENIKNQNSALSQ